MVKETRISSGEFCTDCGDYIGRPIARPRICQACEGDPAQPVIERKPEPVPEVSKIYFKESGLNLWDFYQGETRLFTCTREKGRIRAKYGNVSITKKTPHEVLKSLQLLIK